jgi:FAD/FMN-containing dehydrogenase
MSIQLPSEIEGRIIRPDDPDYDETRQILSGVYDRRPAVIVRAANADDVARVVRFARETGIELAVRAGGHSNAGHSSTDGGIMLDLRDMDGLEIDPESRTAWAEGGLTAGAVTSQLAEHGLAIPFGDTGSVGIGGLTLGGGVGYLVRKHGMAIDNLIAAEIVTADGELLRVDAEHHSDLFWAIRGGGGNYGVVTRFQFRLQPLDGIVGGMLVLPATPETIAGFIAAAEAAPDELSTIANVMSAPPMPFLPEEAHGKVVILAMLAYAGDAADPGRVLAPFRELAEPLADMLRPMSYPEMFPPEDPNYHRPRPRRRCSWIASTAARPRRSCSSSSRPTRRCASRSCACWAARWRACPPTRPRSRIGQARSWSTWPRSTARTTVPGARSGSPTSPRP